MNLKLMKILCKQTEESLHQSLIKFLQEKEGYETVISCDEYIIAEGTLPICLVAHLDTVFHQTPSEFFYDQKKAVLWSPTGAGFDDRAGVYIILQLIKQGFHPHVIFTRGEEIGGIGAHKLISDFTDCPFLDCRAIVQLDRAYDNDAVFYDCDNKDFEKYICKFGFEFNWGTFSDISILAPAWKIAAVNLSVGYLNEHTTSERLYCNCLEATLDKVRKILKTSPNMKSYAYIPWKKDMSNISYGFSFNDHVCLLCGQPIRSGDRHIFETPDIGDYNVCSKCYEDYFDPLTTNSSIIQMGEPAPSPTDEVPFG